MFCTLDDKIWPAGSLEEQVQNFVKTWEMEIFHKMKPQDFKTVDVTKSTVSVNGKFNTNLNFRCFKSIQETLSELIITPYIICYEKTHDFHVGNL